MEVLSRCLQSLWIKPMINLYFLLWVVVVKWSFSRKIVQEIRHGSKHLQRFLINSNKCVSNIPGWHAIEDRFSVWTVYLKIWVLSRIFFTDVGTEKFLLLKCSQALSNWIRKCSFFCFCKCLRLVDLKFCFFSKMIQALIII